MKNRRGAEKRRCQRHKTLDDPRELCDCRCRWYSVHIGPHRDFFFRVLTECRWYLVHIGILFFRVLPERCGSSGLSPGVGPAPGRRCRRCAGPGGHSGRSGGIPGGGSRTRVCGSACRSRRWCPGSGGSHRSAYRRFNQCGGGAASRSRGCQRGMVVKAAGCAGQGILILAWLETRDHFNPFALRASEDFPVDVDRPT